MKTLVIVESPSKAKKIASFLGEDYTVLASYGHITDLAKGGKLGLGVDVDRDFAPRYVLIDEQVKTLETLIKAAESCDQIFLAGDPDREGEAISWHLFSRLEDLRKPIHRIEFNEITKKAVLQAVLSPREINMPLFRSQEARRILDRLVGFMASPFLMNFFGSGLSAGRVQSVITRMLVDREREIETFEPKEFWVIQARLAGKENVPFVAKYEAKIIDELVAKEVEAVLRGANLDARYIVSSVASAEEKRRPMPPLITGRLQQVMSKEHNIPADRTMKAAQSLYEGGYVSYIRTDSVRVSDDALSDVRSLLKEKGFAIPKLANAYKNKDSAQDAHEAIRPTDLSIEPEQFPSSDPDEKLVYQTIYRYFLASQMMPAVYQTLKVSICLKDNPKHLLKASGKAVKSFGFLEMLRISDDQKIDIPNLSEGEELFLFGGSPISIEQKWTQPPARYSEAHLLETLEKKSIGRPATYADLLSKITVRNYAEKRGNVFHPTELGKKITDELARFFSFMEYGYTSEMEEKLDQIASGKVDHVSVLSEFFLPFKKELNQAYLSHGAEICASCQSPMILRTSGNGNRFYGCSSYPRCRMTKVFNNQETVVI